MTFPDVVCILNARIKRVKRQEEQTDSSDYQSEGMQREPKMDDEPHLATVMHALSAAFS